MNLFEFEGKQLFQKYDIPVPESVLLTSEDQAPPLPFPFVLKAQVQTGGRGKAGGVRVCQNEEEYLRNAREILSMTIKGFPVHGLLAEKMVSAEKEYYLSITLQGVSRPTLIFSAAGGMEIETVAKEMPDQILRMEIDPFTRLKGYQINCIADQMNVSREDVRAFLLKLQALFFDKHAMLAEINPLGIVDGKLIALDAKFVYEDHAAITSNEREALENARQSLFRYVTPEKEKTTITYVPLDGNVGMISDGAGTGMLTLDLLHSLGLNVACFTELGGMTSEEVMYRAMDKSLTGHPEIRGLLIVLIGGFNRMDNMARGIIRYLSTHKVDIPVFTRMCGTMEEEGLRLMSDAGLKTFYDLTDAAQSLAKLLKENVGDGNSN